MTNERTCIKQGFWPPIHPKIETYFTAFSLECFIRRKIDVFSFHVDLTLSVAMVTEKDRQNSLK